MTAPLTPADSDLQDFAFMPLHVARLRDSDLAAESHPEACWYAVLLWCASWHQLPAGSLPDNDAVLARLCGLGRDLRTFRKHRAGALRGFSLCDDGRLYHEVVAEQVNDSWKSKLEQRWRTECARIKKRNQRDKTEDAFPTWDQYLAGLPETSRPLAVPRDNIDCPEGRAGDKAGTSPVCPPEKGIQETETGTGRLYSEDKSSAQSADVPDLDRDAWLIAVKVLTEQGAVPEPQARKFFGKLLAANGLEARDLLAAASGAMVNQTRDPQGYLTRSAAGLAKRRVDAAPKRVSFV